MLTRVEENKDGEDVDTRKRKLRCIYKHVNALRLCFEMQTIVYQDLQLSCSFGVGPTKCLSKISSGNHKPFRLS